MSAIVCPDCGGVLVLRHGPYGKFFGCQKYPDCRGAHAATKEGYPVGVPADRETRLARRKILVLLRGIAGIHDLSPSQAQKFLGHVAGREFSTALLTLAECADIMRRYCVAARPQIEEAEREARRPKPRKEPPIYMGDHWEDGLAEEDAWRFDSGEDDRPW